VSVKLYLGETSVSIFILLLKLYIWLDFRISTTDYA